MGDALFYFSAGVVFTVGLAIFIFFKCVLGGNGCCCGLCCRPASADVDKTKQSEKKGSSRRSNSKAEIITVEHHIRSSSRSSKHKRRRGSKSRSSKSSHRSSKSRSKSKSKK